MKNFAKKTLCIILALVLMLCTTACNNNKTDSVLTDAPGQAEAVKIRALIIPKFEVDAMSGDFPGEAQLFYEEYCPGQPEIPLPHLPNGAHFYVNKENSTAILVTGSGKVASSLALSAVLSASEYDFSDCFIISVGCAGGCEKVCTLGDVVLNTAVCDYDLGHAADIREFENKDSDVTWFHDNSYDDFSNLVYNAELAEKAYQMTADIPLRTTDTCKQVLGKNYPDEEWAVRDPKVIKGTVITGDSFWKGVYGQNNCEAIAKYYGCPDPYVVTEMEEMAIADTAVCYGLFDRIISFRVIVNLDVFLKGESPEQLWAVSADYNDTVTEEDGETLDIFEPGMHNLFDVARVVIDAVLAQEIK